MARPFSRFRTTEIKNGGNKKFLFLPLYKCVPYPVIYVAEPERYTSILYRVRIVPRSHVANELTITEKENRETERGLTFGTGHEFGTSSSFRATIFHRVPWLGCENRQV